MKKSVLGFITFCFGLVLITAIFFTIQKTVTLAVDGESHQLQTYALTVDQLLRATGLNLTEKDEVVPPRSHWLREGDHVDVDHASQVVIFADGKEVYLLTPKRNPAEIMALGSISFDAVDQLLADGKVIKPGELLERLPTHSLQLIRATKISLRSGDEEINFSSTRASLGQALWEEGIQLYGPDRLSPLPQTALNANKPVQASLTRSRGLTIQVDGKKIHARSAAESVGEALAESGLSLQGLDYSQPSEDDPLPPDGNIRLVRVQESVIVEQEPLEFGTQYQAVNDLEIDNQKLVQDGEFGLKAHRLRVRYEDGEEVSRKVEGEWVAKKPQDRIVGYGTKVVMHILNTPSGRIRYWRALRMYATSYHPSETGNTTASGLPLKKGVAAVDIRYIPFYTRMYVPDYGEVVAADMGAGVIGRWIDLGYSDNDYVPWHQWVTVYFLWPPPENIVWIFP